MFGGDPLKRLLNLLTASSAIGDLELGRNDSTIAFRKPVSERTRFRFGADNIPGTTSIGWGRRPGHIIGSSVITDPAAIVEISYTPVSGNFDVHVLNGSSLANLQNVGTGGMNIFIKESQQPDGNAENFSLDNIQVGTDYTRFRSMSPNFYHECRNRV